MEDDDLNNETKKIIPAFKVQENSLVPKNTITEISDKMENIFQNENLKNFKGIKSIQISLSYNEVLKNPAKAEELFYNNLVNKNDFFKDPWKILNNSNLLILYNEKLFTYKAAIPVLFSILMYGEDIPDSVLNELNTNKSMFGLISTSNKNLENIKVIGEHEISETVVSKRKESSNRIKTLNPSSDELKLLNLNEGRNEIKFVCKSRLSGHQTLFADIYLWNYTDSIVISDVDGTITRSDVLGHIMPILGQDWSHEGVTDLFTNIAKNGYKMLYLTARAICQSSTTKNYIQTLFQNQKCLPRGPILMSPDGLVSSFKREVIDKTPQTFKIACLTEIKNLFPKIRNPFISGFGNRTTVRDYINFRMQFHIEV